MFSTRSFSTRSLYILITLLLLLPALLCPVLAYDRVVLIEDYTNTSCGPCATYTPNVVNGIAGFAPEQIAFWACHVNWPGANDPWYVQNPDDNRSMWTSRAVTGVPSFFIDGPKFASINSAAAVTQAVQARINKAAPIKINVFAAPQGNEISVKISIESEENLANVKLYVSIGEHLVNYNAPNGMNQHHGSMLDMMAIAENINLAPGNVWQKTYKCAKNFSVGGRASDIKNLEVIAWVQDGTNEVLNAGKAGIIEGPILDLEDWEFREVDGNGDTRPEENEEWSVVFKLGNPDGGMDMTSATVELTCDNDGVIVSDGAFNIGALPAGEFYENNDKPIAIMVPPDFKPDNVTFTLKVVTQPGGVVNEYFRSIIIGWPEVLVVDASRNSYASQSIMSGFDNAVVPFAERWERGTTNYPSSSYLNHFKAIVWHSHNAADSIMTEAEENALMYYLDHGGTLIMTGTYLAKNYGARPLIANYMKAELDSENVRRGQNIKGMDGHAIFNGVKLYLGRGGAGSADKKPSLKLNDDVEPFLQYVDGEAICGITRETENFRTMFIAFPLETAAGAYETNTIEDFMPLVKQWIDLGGGLSVKPRETAEPTGFTLDGAYPNPFNSSMAISFTLESASDVRLTVLDINGREVAQLANGRVSAGSHSVTLNANEIGISGGVYFVRLTSNGVSLTQKVVYLK